MMEDRANHSIKGRRNSENERENKKKQGYYTRSLEEARLLSRD